MIRMCYIILRNNAPQSESTCLGYRVLWSSQIFREGELLVRKRLVQVSDKYPGICSFHYPLWTMSSPNSRTKAKETRSLFLFVLGHQQDTSEAFRDQWRRNLESQSLICHRRCNWVCHQSGRYLGRLGYKGRAARRKPLLRPANIARRYRWAKEIDNQENHWTFGKLWCSLDEYSFAQFSRSGHVWSGVEITWSRILDKPIAANS